MTAIERGLFDPFRVRRDNKVKSLFGLLLDRHLRVA